MVFILQFSEELLDVSIHLGKKGALGVFERERGEDADAFALESFVPAFHFASKNETSSGKDQGQPFLGFHSVTAGGYRDRCGGRRRGPGGAIRRRRAGGS